MIELEKSSRQQIDTLRLQSIQGSQLLLATREADYLKLPYYQLPYIP